MKDLTTGSVTKHLLPNRRNGFLAEMISRMPGFEIREIWYLSVASIVFQICVNLLLLRHELRRRLQFDEPEDFIPASVTAS